MGGEARMSDTYQRELPTVEECQGVPYGHYLDPAPRSLMREVTLTLRAVQAQQLRACREIARSFRRAGWIP